MTAFVRAHRASGEDVRRPNTAGNVRGNLGSEDMIYTSTILFRNFFIRPIPFILVHSEIEFLQNLYIGIRLLTDFNSFRYTETLPYGPRNLYHLSYYNLPEFSSCVSIDTECASVPVLKKIMVSWVFIVEPEAVEALLSSPYYI